MGLFDFFSRRKEQVPPPPRVPKDLDTLVEAARKMSPFDFATGRLCAETYRDRGGVDQTIYYGMLEVFRAALRQGLESPEEATRLLDSKAAQKPDGQDFVEGTEQLADALAGRLKEPLHARAKHDDVPTVVEVLTAVVKVFEGRRPRPAPANLRGHYALLADWTFASGLHLSRIDPRYAKQLADEPY